MKRNALILMIIALLAVGMTACGGAKKETTPAPTSQSTSGGDAEKIFQQSCATCHGGDLKGQIGPNLTKVGSKYSEQDIEKIIKNGRGGMPAGVITGADATKVAEWLSEKK